MENVEKQVERKEVKVEDLSDLQLADAVMQISNQLMILRDQHTAVITEIQKRKNAISPVVVPSTAKPD
jgi:hypothetical protein